MRAPATALVVGLLAPVAAVAGRPYRDDLPIPSYRLLSSMLAQLRDSSPFERGEASVDVAAPLITALDQKYGARVEADLRRALKQRDREEALRATTVLVLLDTQDLLEGIARDDYTGWADAKVCAKKAFLNYRLVTDELHALLPELDHRAVAAFGELALRLHDSDLSTPLENVIVSRDALARELARLRQSLNGTRSPRRDGGAGG